ncbi:MAG: hypothetical protein RLZZ558_1563, partial [Planctomycetota bacterium]
RDEVVAAMTEVRRFCDSIEKWTPADLWPLPTYAEMLLGR